jgi:hypothetical protein
LKVPAVLLQRCRLPAAALLGAFVYAAALGQLARQPRTVPMEEMRVALPRIVQLVATAGDRYLAANVATIRALVASAEGLTPDQYYIQGRVQMDAAVLNPYNQDNYFVAGAILAWNGELDAAQFVLRKAAEARTFDIWPAYWNGFYEWHLRKNPLEGARWLRIAESHTSDERFRMGLREMAAAWTASHEDAGLALRLLKEMADSTNEPLFRKNLRLRIQRIEGLLQLRDAATRYRERYARPPVSIEQLVDSSMIASIPDDPFKIGYAVAPDGTPVFKNVLKRSPQTSQK